MRFSTFAAAAIGAVLLALTPGASAAENAVRPFDSESWQEVAGAHKGQPVIVHFWAFSCGNCMVELKDWGRFLREHPGTTIVFVNWDHHAAEADRITASLAKAGLGGVQSLALSNGFEEKLRFSVDHNWMGELPYTRLIASDGSATAFSGSADFEELKDWLAKNKRQ
jgi:thiol-disulfide isomerase/thioredoxin